MNKETLLAEAGLVGRAGLRTLEVLSALVFTLAGLVFVGAGLADFFGNGSTHYLEKAPHDVAAAAVFLWTDDRASEAVEAGLMLIFGTIYWRRKFLGEGFFG